MWGFLNNPWLHMRIETVIPSMKTFICFVENTKLKDKERGIKEDKVKFWLRGFH
jgi:hypothetical protein